MSFQWEQCLCSGAEEANVKRVGPASAWNDGFRGKTSNYLRDIRDTGFLYNSGIRISLPFLVLCLFEVSS